MTVSENGNNPCDGCRFLADCRYKVKRFESPYCWLDNPRHFMFIQAYFEVDGEGPRKQIAAQLAKVTPYTEYRRNEMDNRNAELVLLRNEGHSYQKLGHKYGITKERARQIYQEVMA